MTTTTMRTPRFLRLGLVLPAALAAITPSSVAEAVLVEDFFTLRSATATTLSGTGNTASPVLGTSGTTGSGARMIGYFAPQTLTNVGDKITLSFTFELGPTASNATDQFRFALYDRNGESPIATNSNLNVVGNDNTDAFRGYWFGVDTNTAGTGAQGSIRRRAGTDLAQDDPFANASAASLGAVGGTEVVFAAGPTYTGFMTLTLTGANEITLSGSMKGSNSASAENLFSAVDAAAATTYSVVGFLNGGSLSAAQVTFHNITVTLTAVPEAASAAMLGVVGGATGLIVSVRRRLGSQRK